MSLTTPFLKQEPVVRRLPQLVSEIGVRNTDQRLCSLAHALAEQLRGTVFGHYVVHVIAAGGHPRARLQYRDEPRYLTPKCSRWESDNGPPAPRVGCSSNEVGLPAYPAVKAAPDRVGTN